MQYGVYIDSCAKTPPIYTVVGLYSTINRHKPTTTNQLMDTSVALGILKHKLRDLVNSDRYHTQDLRELLIKCYATDKTFSPKLHIPADGQWDELAQPYTWHDVPPHVDPNNIPYWYWTFHRQELQEEAKRYRLQHTGCPTTSGQQTLQCAAAVDIPHKHQIQGKPTRHTARKNKSTNHALEFRHNLETWITQNLTKIGTKEIPSGEKRGREDDGQSPISKKVATGQGDVDPIPSLNPNDGNLGTSSDAQTATQNPGRTITLTLKKKANLKTKLRNDKMMTGRLYQIVTVGPIDNDKLEELII